MGKKKFALDSLLRIRIRKALSDAVAALTKTTWPVSPPPHSRLRNNVGSPDPTRDQKKKRKNSSSALLCRHQQQQQSPVAGKALGIRHSLIDWQHPSAVDKQTNKGQHQDLFDLLLLFRLASRLFFRRWMENRFSQSDGGDGHFNVASSMYTSLVLMIVKNGQQKKRNENVSGYSTQPPASPVHLHPKESQKSKPNQTK
jgi:hypothetical protein